MKFLKALGIVAAADILSLFIVMTFAGSSMTVMRLVCSVCTVGILLCFVISHAANSAKAEKGGGAPFAVGAVMSAPALVSWVILLISRTSGAFNYYPIHKLVNGYYLQIYNLINSDANASALGMGEIFGMAALIPIPFIAYTAAYLKSSGGARNE